jgi:hypothetical protein
MVSSDSKFKLDGPEIRNEYWAVHVDMALMQTEKLVWSRKNCNTLGNAEKSKDCMAFNLCTWLISCTITTCIMKMHCVLIVHFVFLFVDSKDKWMSIWERGDYTAMMMSMFHFMMMMMMDAFSFSYVVGMTFLSDVVPQFRWIFIV